MSSILYLDCSSGISGDMTVAALLDLGADEKVLKKALDSLDTEGFEVRISRVKKGGIEACDFQVILDSAHDGHDHDMEYLHGPGHDKEEKQEQAHSHRGLAQILETIHKAQMTQGARKLASGIFHILAQAEAKAHGVSVKEVHFHEVGAVDSIVDIVAAAVCLDNLGIHQVAVPVLCDGHGTIRCRHGVIPVPVPAVVNIAQEHGLTLQITEVEGELVTPTGAAIVAAIRTTDKLPRQFRIRRTGLGAGKRTYERPSILRAMLLEEEHREQDEIYKLETNIDDCCGEVLGHTMNLLLEAGARDVHYAPVFMKKNRPAYQLNVICTPEDVERLEGIIFRETTTIGIRRVRMERTVLPRETETVQTSLGPAQVKVCSWGTESWVYPEYESVTRLARENGCSYRDAYENIRKECALPGQDGREV